MNYSTAQALKEGGYSQEYFGGFYLDKDGKYTSPQMTHSNFPGIDDTVYVPTLEELIEELGDSFKCLRNFRHEMWAAHGREEGERQWKETWPNSPEWVAEAVETYSSDEGTTGHISAHGETPKEAAANLYLDPSLKKRV